ncbi:hypothetical protein SDRG_07328 [Saprolegnia diclina VS20]|uniref:Secreted protein n=1 Tax=Saprolegnia diclina (strain VS20) TaxID=1156394 RepID=T0QB37_SAPDV|nr:hypothetical protein SDRG_07328 [Saprolegnia diclina VS20]EQC35094.1 hypothetical protein SDRG_07328 [Saprolegnia diclina VS20]|eukprot:XP_008611378.1 hypothetical protein SDRG_07328 [Saprolegnia diclina VS20]
MKFFAVLLAAVAIVFAQETTTDAPTTKPAASKTPAPTKCARQYTSPCTTAADCGDLNGFNLTCITSGDNKMCSFNGGVAVINVRQNSSADGLVHQYGDCTINQCNSGHGFTEDKTNIITCQETLACVKEINDKPGVVLRSQCHTCGSCKAQSVKETRFDCTKVCPKTPAPTTKSLAPGATAAPGSGSGSTATTTRAPKTAAPVATTAPSSASSLFASGVVVAAIAFAQLC